MKCDVDLVEGEPEPLPVSPPAWRRRLEAMRRFKIEDWLKLGAFVYVGLEILATFIGRTGILVRRPGNPEEWGATLAGMVINTLAAAVQGALYYGVGELIGLVRKAAGSGDEG
ncbi:MAG: hypothetical protein K6U80_19745 [Firmicutes bacterium]|nr:hypothetical protein [Bacillota bacterium]